MDCQRAEDAGSGQRRLLWIILGPFALIVLVAAIFTASTIAERKTQVRVSPKLGFS